MVDCRPSGVSKHTRRSRLSRRRIRSTPNGRQILLSWETLSASRCQSCSARRRENISSRSFRSRTRLNSFKAASSCVTVLCLLASRASYQWNRGIWRTLKRSAFRFPWRRPIMVGPWIPVGQFQRLQGNLSLKCSWRSCCCHEAKGPGLDRNKDLEN